MARLLTGSATLTGLAHTAGATTGIANTNTVVIDHASVADNDFAKFTSSGLEGRSYSETLSDIRTTGIANTNTVIIDHASVADNDFAKFTASGLEGRSYTEVLSDISAIGASNPTVTLGDNATFPDGMVIQVVNKFVDQADHVTLAGSDPSVFTLMSSVQELEIEPLHEDSILSMWATIHPYGSGSGVNAVAYDIYDTRASAWIGAIGSANGGVSGYIGGVGFIGGSSLIHCSTAAVSTAARDYKLGMKNPVVGTTLYDRNDGIFQFTILEIKQ